MFFKSFKIHKKDNLNDSSYGTLYEEWQKQIFKINKLIIFFMTIVELLFFVLYIYDGFIDIPLIKYLGLYIFRPLGLNLIFFFIALRIYNSKKSSVDTKIIVPMILMVSIMSVLVMVHYVYSSLYLVFLIPILISMIYASKKIEKKVFISCIIGVTFAFLGTLLDTYSIRPIKFMYHIIITYVLIYVTHKIVQKMIILENSKEELLDDTLFENYRLNQKLLYDGLTKLYNHTALFTFLNEKISKYNDKHDFYLAVLDIDFFKKVNDTYGHEVGNVILTKLGKILNKYKSENIFPARYGGEEFAIVFNHMNIDEVIIVLEEIRKEFSECNFVEVNYNVITLSVGLASYDKGLKSGEFFEKADKCLYEAKNTGRDKICY